MISDQAALPTSVSQVEWDAIVIGAGPAGALAARQLAWSGLSTLLLDAKAFPREKVCGGCLNRSAVLSLQKVGLGHVLKESGGAVVRGIRVIAGRRTIAIPLPEGLAICRKTFDAALAEAAVRAGATFLPGTKGIVEEACHRGRRAVRAIRRDGEALCSARVVLCADGLSRSSVKNIPELVSRVSIKSRIGIGATLECNANWRRDDEITMVVGRQGYVGMVRAGAEQVNVAAAVDGNCLTGRSIGETIAAMFAEGGVSVLPGLKEANWQGTSPLTSVPRDVAADRILLLGDAAGYVEPFTGDGMAIALECALSAAPLAAEGARKWRPEIARHWRSLHRRIVRDRQRTCRQLAWGLRRPGAVAAAISACRASPLVARYLVSRVN